MRHFIFVTRRAVLLFGVVMKHTLFALLDRTRTGRNYPVHVREAMEELGLTYLKLGQFLALRDDILPEELCQELSKLFEAVPPMSPADVRDVIESELGGRLESVFPYFNPEPIGAASVAQVHEARLDNGQKVAVKVQRAGIRRTFVADMRILYLVADLLDRLHVLGQLSVREMAGEFATWTLREMDFLTEGRTADYLRRYTQPYEVIPKIYWGLTTQKVLTMQFLEGTSLAHLRSDAEVGEPAERAAALGLDLGVALHHLAFASLHQLFVIGFFHGDPHPGNILIRGDNSVVFLDFGIFGALNETERQAVLGLTENIAVGNVGESFRFYAMELTPTEETDPRTFEEDAKSVLRQWYEATTGRGENGDGGRHLGKYIAEMIAVSRRNHLRMGMNYLLFWRALNSLDATALKLMPQFDLMGELRSFFAQIRPSFATRLAEALADPQRLATAAGLVYAAPGQVSLLLSQLSRGQYEWPVSVQESPRVQSADDRDMVWLSIAIASISLALAAGAAYLRVFVH